MATVLQTRGCFRLISPSRWACRMRMKSDVGLGWRCVGGHTAAATPQSARSVKHIVVAVCPR